MISIEQQGVIYDATRKPEPERVASSTSLLATSRGDILCGFQVGPAKNVAGSTIRLCRSVDGGLTWNELSARFETSFHEIPGSLASAGIVETTPGRLLLLTTWFDRTDPTRPLFDPATEGILHSRMLCSESRDWGQSWSAWRDVPTAGLRGCSTTEPLFLWNDGTLVLPFESYKEFDEPAPHPHAAHLLLSRDGGQTFSDPIPVAQDPAHRVYYWDQRLCAGAKTGEYIALFWTHDLSKKMDLNVHIKRSSIYNPRSAAQPPSATSLRGQIAAPLLLPDGRLLAFVVDRQSPASMILGLSRDGGASWNERDSRVIYRHEEKSRLTQRTEDIDFKAYWEDMLKWSFGHPAICRLDGERVLLAYYAGEPSCMSIHGAQVRIR